MMNKPFTQARNFIADAIGDSSYTRRRASSFSFFGWFVAGVAIGGSAMYLLDPVEGKKRRTQILHRGAELKHNAFQLALRSQSWKESARGLWAKISGAITGSGSDLPRHLAPKTENPSYLH